MESKEKENTEILKIISNDEFATQTGNLIKNKTTISFKRNLTFEKNKNKKDACN